MSESQQHIPVSAARGSRRGAILAASFIVMMIISVYQYSWFLFAYALQEEFHWSLATIGLTFTVYAYGATFVQPFSGFIADTYGPRLVSIFASVVVGAGLIVSSFATTPLVLYVFYGMGGLGVGILYGVSTACAVKWFPDRRGFATGLVVFGFGAGTALLNLLIQHFLETAGVQQTFFFIGIIMMVILVPLSFFYRYPDGVETRSPAGQSQHAAGEKEFRPQDMVRTPQWFVMYFSFIVTVSVVLVFGAQMKSMAREFNLSKGAFTALMILFPLGNGLSRVVAGAISDIIGREKTMSIFYSLLGIAILLLVAFGDVPALFLAIVFIAALLGGSPFALYPATVGDYYGAAYSTVNYGVTYTAKAWAGLISGWLSGYLVMQYGSYKIPLLIIACLSLVAGVVSNPYILKAPRYRRRAVDGE